MDLPFDPTRTGRSFVLPNATQTYLLQPLLSCTWYFLPPTEIYIPSLPQKSSWILNNTQNSLTSLFLTYIYPIQESDFSKKTVARIKSAKLWRVNLHLHEPKNRVYSSFVFYISLRLSWIFVVFKHLSLSSNEKDIIFPWSLEGFLTKKKLSHELFLNQIFKK